MHLYHQKNKKIKIGCVIAAKGKREAVMNRL
jgi:hypothetical protein